MTSPVKRERAGIEVERAENERLVCVHDQAQAREIEHRKDAMRDQAVRALLANGGTPGRCNNCEERCLPTAVYCDVQCRADHEQRLQAERRLRGRR